MNTLPSQPNEQTQPLLPLADVEPRRTPPPNYSLPNNRGGGPRGGGPRGGPRGGYRAGPRGSYRGGRGGGGARPPPGLAATSDAQPEPAVAAPDAVAPPNPPSPAMPAAAAAPQRRGGYGSGGRGRGTHGMPAPPHYQQGRVGPAADGARSPSTVRILRRPPTGPSGKPVTAAHDQVRYVCRSALTSNLDPVHSLTCSLANRRLI